MRRLSFIALLFLSAYGYAQFPMVGSGRQVYRPDQVDSLFYWFDAQDLATITTTNNKVTAWADKGPFGYDVVQADTSKAPTYSATSGPGGSTAALTFDGTNDFLASASHFWGSDDISIFAVVKFANATRDAAETIVAKFYTTTNERQWRLYGTAASTSYAIFSRYHNDGQVANYTQSSYSSKSTTWKVHSVINAVSSQSVFEDGADIKPDNSLAGTGNGVIYNNSNNYLEIAAINSRGTASTFLQGSISEIIVFSRTLTNAERQGIEAYLSSKYNIALQNKQKPKVIIQN